MDATFKHHMDADRRLVVLSVLSNSPGYQANAYAIEAVLCDMGHVVSADRVQTDLTWLAEQGLLTTSKVGGVTIAKITQRGHDVARGKAEQPGVKRPQPD